MTETKEIPDDIMAKAREVVANIPGKITAPQFAAMAIARAILSERTASEAALKEARDGHLFEVWNAKR